MTATVSPRRHVAVCVAAIRCVWSSRAVARQGGERLAALLRPASRQRVAGDPDDARRATRLALLTLRALARLPGGGWRDSCLYQAITECLVLRTFGFAATLELGVRGAADEEVAAHAWVRCAAVSCLTSPGVGDAGYVTLR